MNKQELVIKLADQTGTYKAVAERFVNAFTEIVSEALAEGDKVQLIGFGTFETRERSARCARNPQSGEKITIQAKTAPAFKAGKALKDKVNR